ncbi:MAG: RING finger protein [Halapricum sp.]
MQALNECRYCGKKLATGGRVVSCEACETGFHVECAKRADELMVDVTSRLLRSDTYEIECPDCGARWNLGFDPSD